MDTKLTFVNRSLAGHTSEVVIFQKNLAMDLDAPALAWKVIRYCGRDCTHPFVYSSNYEVALGDEWGNYSPRLPASNGQSFAAVAALGGRRQLRPIPAPAPAPAGEIQVLNELPKGAVNACLYKAGHLVGIKTTVAPGQKAIFRYKPTIWIGVMSEVVEGTAIDSAVMPAAAAELSLLGVASADIVMTGGGPGPDAKPYAFTLENVVPM